MTLPDDVKSIKVWYGTLGQIKKLSNNLPMLIELDISHNKLSSSDFYFLPQLICPNLEVLNLEENHLSSAGSEFLSKSNFPNLLILNLNQK